MNVLDAFHQTVHAAPGGCEALAVRLGVSAQVLRNKANPNSAYHKPTLEDADRVMGITGDHAVLHALALNHGYVCSLAGGDDNSSDAAVLEMVAKAWKEGGEVGTEVFATLADGVVEPHEIERVEQAVYRAERSLRELVSRLKGMAKK